MDGLVEGRIVHYVLGDREHRPAIVVKVWRDGDGNVPEDGCSNLQVFMDGDGGGNYNDNAPNVVWKTSVMHSDAKEPHSWHWIEKA